MTNQHNRNDPGAAMYISDLVGDRYKNWDNEFIVFDADTGTGKTYFVLHILAPYAKPLGRRILYLCNREQLCKRVQSQVQALEHSHVSVMTYQKLHLDILENKEDENFDYIIFDEVHYLLSDSFNGYTDVMSKYLINQSDNVCILMSATANPMFSTLLSMDKVKDENYFAISKDYSYVKKIILYDEGSLSAWIDDILANHPGEKIIVFCNSSKRMLTMHEIYGDDADYFCSSGAENKQLRAICNPDAIIHHSDSHISFGKPILFSTKVLDNGIDFKDTAIKHIFTELFEKESLVQSIGRKRPLSQDDTCTLYIKNYKKYAVKYIERQILRQVEPIRLFKENKDEFLRVYGYGKKRDEWRKLKCLYVDVDNMSNAGEEFMSANIRINHIMYQKFCFDLEDILLIQAIGYDRAIQHWLVDELVEKIEVRSIDPVATEARDSFTQYLEASKSKHMYKPEQDDLKMEFRKIMPGSRTMGIRKLCGILEDMGYPYIIESCKDRRRFLDDGTKNPNRNKYYWVIGDFDWKIDGRKR